MSKTRNLSKVLALVIMLALVLTVLPMGAMAAPDEMATFNFPATLAVRKATVSASGGGGLRIIDTIGPIAGKNRYECQVELSPATSANAVLICLRDGNNALLTSSTVNLPASGTIAETLSYGGYDYIFTIVREPAYVDASDGSGVYLSMPDDGVSLGSCTTSTSPFLYPNATTAAPGFPQNVSLRIVPGGTNYENVTDISVTVNSGSAATLSHVAGTFYVASFPSSGSALNFTVSYTEGTAKTTVTSSFVITLTHTGTVPTGDDIYAFLPAPGQFVNEGIGTGGWGTVYTGTGTAMKDMVGNIAATGVCLGYFGGYIVFDMGQTAGVDNVQNTDTHPYGVDFIVYGNAFIGNSEPGCIQVYGRKPNETTYAWYNIAGSLHYDPTTIWNAQLTYTNPTPADDQTNSTSSTRANVTYTGSDSGTIVTNSYHDHSWYPLNRNYFTTGIDHLNDLGWGHHERDAATGAGWLRLTGTLLGSATTTATENYTFGYADVHPKNNTSGFTAFGAAYNPYSVTATDVGSASAWSTFLGSTYGGGDPIDISWAVDMNGEPVNLASVRMVRVYTGAASMNPNQMSGEISTEVCGIYAVSATTGSGSTTVVTGAELTVTGVSNPALASTITSANTYNVTADVPITVSYASSGNTVFVNGESGNGSASLVLTLGEGVSRIIRVIAKDATTGLPYIGYMKLVGE